MNIMIIKYKDFIKEHISTKDSLLSRISDNILDIFDNFVLDYSDNLLEPKFNTNVSSNGFDITKPTSYFMTSLILRDTDVNMDVRLKSKLFKSVIFSKKFDTELLKSCERSLNILKAYDQGDWFCNPFIEYRKNSLFKMERSSIVDTENFNLKNSDDYIICSIKILFKKEMTKFDVKLNDKNLLVHQKSFYKGNNYN